MNGINLSGCLIVKNEAENLAVCLASIQPYLNELIVVDTGSTDDTVAIAQQFGATVHHFEWCDDFAAARNFALSLVQGEWILMPDADEELVVPQSDWVQLLPQNPDILALQLKLRSPQDQVTAMQTIRVFRNLPALRYVGAYHEHLTWQGQPLPNHAIAPLKGVEMIHYGYELERLPQKSALRIPMMERMRQNQGLSFMLLWTLSGMYECTGQWDQAQGCYEEAAERLFTPLLMDEKPEDFRAVPSWLYGLGEQYLQSEDWESLNLLCQRALTWCPNFPPVYYLTGLMLQALGFPLGARPYFEACLDFAKSGQYDQGEPFDPEILTTLPHYELAQGYLRSQDYQLAQHHGLKSLETHPTFEPAIQLLDNLSPLLE